MARWLCIVALVTLAPGCTLYKALGIGEGGKAGPPRNTDPDDSNNDSNEDPDDGQSKGNDAPVVEADPDFETPDPNDDEAGVRQLSRLMRRFNRSLGAKNFKDATKVLGFANKAVLEASDLTRSHPDFEDTALAVERARNRLEVAIETDRIERRNAAIDDLIKRGNRAKKEASNLYAQLANRTPEREDVELLSELVSTMRGLANEGNDFLDEARYAEHADTRDQMADALEKMRDTAKWQLNAGSVVGRPIETAYNAAVAGKKATNIDEELVAYQRSAAGFKVCLAKIADIASDPYYDEDLEIDTVLGSMSLGETESRCEQLFNNAVKKVEEVQWRQHVLKVIDKTDDAVAAVRKNRDFKKALRLSQKAVEVLAECVRDLDNTERKAGFVAARRFDSVLGQLPADDLRRACEQQRSRIAKDLPRIKWRGGLEAMLGRIEDAATTEKKALAAKPSQTRVKLWTATVGGLQECIDQARAAMRISGADRNLKLATAFGKMSVPQLERECIRRKSEADTDLKKALADRELDEFMAGLKGDEKSVAKREGIPDKIDKYDAGRVFIYERPVKGRRQPEIRRIGFDHQGKRIDFWVQWRNSVVGVVAELARVTAAVESAPTAAQVLTATRTAFPVLDVCQETLEASKKSPGYDPSATFSTALGKHNIQKLIGACSQEKKRLEGTVRVLEWRASLEKIRDRLDEAVDQIEKSKSTESPKQRIDLLSTAMGSLQECKERAEALGKEEGLDARYRVETKVGKATVWTIGKSCDKVRTQAQAAVDQALKDKELLAFLKTCKGDEVEVAQREGKPTSVEKVGSGRVFVYAAPKKGRKSPPAKRFAFDRTGKRVDERFLKDGK